MRVSRSFVAALFLAAGLASPVMGQVPSTPAASPVDGAQRKAALDLAGTIYSVENQTLGMENFLQNSFGPTLLKEPSIREMEDASPGMVKAIVEAMRPIFRQFIVDELPAYHAGVADIYVAHLTTDEMIAMKRFFETPTGQKLVRGVHSNMTFDSMMTEIVADPNAPTSRKAIEDDQMAAVGRAVRSIDVSDRSALEAAIGSTWISKVKVMRPKLLDHETKYMNQPSPKFEAAIEEAMLRVIGERFPEGSSAKR